MADPEFEVVKNSKAKSDIWKHFGLKKRKNDGKIETNVAVCYLCDGTVKYSGGTSNLISHIRVYHPSRASVNNSTCTANAGACAPVRTILDNRSQAQQTLPNILAARYPPKSPRAIAITNSISNFIIKDLRPYKIVDSPEFRKMLNTLDSRYQCPSRKQFSDVHIPQKYAEVKVKVVEELKKATQVAVTTDGWTSRATESYVTVTSIHIDDQWKLQNFVLQTRCMPESHTGENIAEALEQTLDEWNIPRSPLFMVSDNASNMTKAGELLNCELHLGCYAHTLNLAVQRCLAVPTVSRMLARIRKIVGFFHRSSVAADMLKTQATLLGLPYHKLVIDVSTRWNSAYDMLDRYLSMQAAVVSVLVSKDLKHKDKGMKFLSDEEITVAEDVVRCLKPLKDITTTMCSESSPTASIILPIHHQLQTHILVPKEGDSPTIINMKKSMSENLKDRYAAKKQVLNKITALDPRFKSMPYMTEEERLSVFSELVKEAGCQQITVKTEPVDTNDNLMTTTQEAEPPLPTLSLEGPSPPKEMPAPPKVPKTECPPASTNTTLGDILGDVYITKIEPASEKSKLQKADDEVSQYKNIPGIGVNTNPLDWWMENEGKFPLLALLAKKYLCIPGTSVPSERVFSTAGDIVTAQRASLKSKHVDMLIFLKKNLKC